ncbi:MAG: uroporphyrinogen-III C-methyltransferase, partial [Burkholderiales bacterium]|nr:uroporphyrinogen-III C-methyltransferase [Burkholderiales bacterium]
MSEHPDQLPAPPSPGRETARDRPGAEPGVGPEATAPASGTAPPPLEGGVAASATRARWPAPALLLAAGAAVLAAVAVALAWQSLDRVHKPEAELVRRQQAGTEAVAEARAAARHAQEQSSEAAAKAALLELRVAEIAAARQQVDELLQSMTRSRDEGVLAELDAGLRLAMHQSAITGSGDAVLLSLRHAEERLAQLGSPVLERVRRAVAVDLERAGAGSAPDPAALAALLDDALRGLDALPLLAEPSQAAASKSPQAP